MVLAQHRQDKTDWGTSPDVLSPVLEAFGVRRFAADVCCSAPFQYWDHADTYLESGGLEADWSVFDGPVWCNAPGKAQLWWHKFATEVKRGAFMCYTQGQISDSLRTPKTSKAPVRIPMTNYPLLISKGRWDFWETTADKIKRLRKAGKEVPPELFRYPAAYLMPVGQPTHSNAIVLAGEFDPTPLLEIGALMLPV